MSISLEGEIVTNLEFFCMRNLSILHLFIQSLISVYTHGCLFYIVGYNPILCYLFCSKCFCYGHWELFFQLEKLAPIFSDTPPSMLGGF